ncbi:hypothetical protein Lal_00032987 [Lupinus albus]|nr:hypothetical protein Lal_00032987 [Lupinus albus]
MVIKYFKINDELRLLIQQHLLNDDFVPKHFWVEAINTTRYIPNKIYIRLNLIKTPYQLKKVPKSNIPYFHLFGYKCYILNTKDELGKFNVKADSSIILGYTLIAKGFRVYNSRILFIGESINLRFDDKQPDKRLLELNYYLVDLNLNKSEDQNKNKLEESVDDQHEDLTPKHKDCLRSWNFKSYHPQYPIIGNGIPMI